MTEVIDLTGTSSGTSSEEEWPSPRMGARMARADAKRRRLHRATDTDDSKPCPGCGAPADTRTTPTSNSVQPVLCRGCRLRFCGRCGLRSQYQQTSGLQVEGRTQWGPSHRQWGLQVGPKIDCRCPDQHLYHIVREGRRQVVVR